MTSHMHRLHVWFHPCHADAEQCKKQEVATHVIDLVALNGPLHTPVSHNNKLTNKFWFADKLLISVIYRCLSHINSIPEKIPVESHVRFFFCWVYIIMCKYRTQVTDRKPNYFTLYHSLWKIIPRVTWYLIFHLCVVLLYVAMAWRSDIIEIYGKIKGNEDQLCKCVAIHT